MENNNTEYLEDCRKLGDLRGFCNDLYKGQAVEQSNLIPYNQGAISWVES